MRIDENLLKLVKNDNKKITKNFGYIYYKFDADKENQYGRNLIKEKIENLYIENFQIPNTDNFKLKTKKPGLIIGSGYPHYLRDSEDFKIGFYFDHTFGLPIIPGSSIKGMLRSFIDLKKYPQKKEFMKNFAKNVNLDELIEVFENTSDKKIIFYDAFISDTNNGRIFDFDYIAPHKDEFQDPVPIKFLKLLNDVEFTFQFRFFNFEKEEKENILNLFKELIKKFGLGANTRKGYGKFK
jgi:CRISPR-associated protein Cmr6